MSGLKENLEITDAEAAILTELIYKKYGHDFSDYAQNSFKRRLSKVMQNFKITRFDDFKDRVIGDEFFFRTFLEQITVNVTEMFRDPEFFKTIRNDILPQLVNYPLIRIWHAGCSSGEEVYSTAILLKESGLLERSWLYATDINEQVLENAASGKFTMDMMNKYEENYLNSGGQKKFSDYYTMISDKAVFGEELKNRMIFSQHNLVFDRSFNEFNLIFCRNVLIYFNRDLQNKVIQLFSDSLPNKGFLALGSKENIEFIPAGKDYEIVNRQQRIWKKNDLRSKL